ncbi:MAG: sugar ABC transporter substrate-binding protein [Clostridiales bacterium]|nr:sugar ABC transporter substrate-binding protein [Clostridiales bacterium]
MKKMLALLLTAAMLLSMCTIGAMAEERELLVIDFYDEAANYHGIQTGWFAKVIKDRFNVELNIIAPQVAGEAVYATRAAEGNLGDVLIMDKNRFAECVEAGLVKDISDKLPGCENIMQYKLQIDTFNQNLGKAEGVYYGIPDQMTDTSPVTLTAEMVYSQPQIRWDLYKAAGAPKVADLDGLLDLLAKIHEIHPTNEAGDPAYPFTLWPDWDNNDNMSGPANVVQLTTWLGDKVKGAAILKPDNTFTKLTDETAGYYKITKFINKAYQMGLVDPESFEQDWNSVCSKISNGQVDLIWYNWEIGFWNSQERMDNGTAFQVIPLEDGLFYADADSYYGSTRAWGVGSKVEGAKYDRIMELLDWLASPEGLVFQHIGIEGFNYEVNADGTYSQLNDNALMDNLPTPAEYGGGGYQDGNNQINQWLCASICTNPATGETYDVKFWASYIEKTMTDMKREWMAHFDAKHAVDWMEKNGKLLASPNVSVSLAVDTNDITLIRNDINKVLCKYTWQMFAAETDDQFDALWAKMVKEMEGLDYNSLYEFDCAKWQVEVDAKVAAAEAFTK